MCVSLSFLMGKVFVGNHGCRMKEETFKVRRRLYEATAHSRTARLAASTACPFDVAPALINTSPMHWFGETLIKKQRIIDG